MWRLRSWEEEGEIHDGPAQYRVIRNHTRRGGEGGEGCFRSIVALGGGGGGDALLQLFDNGCFPHCSSNLRRGEKAEKKAEKN